MNYILPLLVCTYNNHHSYVLTFVLTHPYLRSFSGILLGLAYQAGINCKIRLPPIFQTILSATSTSTSTSTSASNLPNKNKMKNENRKYSRKILDLEDSKIIDIFTQTAGWILRQGLTSVYPEVGWTDKLYGILFY